MLHSTRHIRGARAIFAMRPSYSSLAHYMASTTIYGAPMKRGVVPSGSMAHVSAYWILLSQGGKNIRHPSATIQLRFVTASLAQVLCNSGSVLLLLLLPLASSAPVLHQHTAQPPPSATFLPPADLPPADLPRAPRCPPQPIGKPAR